MRGRLLTIAATLTITLAGCQPNDSTTTANSSESATVERDQAASDMFAKQLPATYQGTLPCADCEGIVYQLNLMPDHRYQLQMRYLDDGDVNNSHSQQGLWQISGKQLQLDQESAFSIEPDGVLRKLDTNGQAIDSELNYDLSRQRDYQPLSNTVTITDTEWRLTEIRGNAVTEFVDDASQAPHMTLNEGEQRVSGFAGCNNFNGQYQNSQQQIEFAKIATTRKMCEQTMAIEKQFVATLEQVTEWYIEANKLYLLNESGDAIAVFKPLS
ncbi:META domain-containing protein [Idiomarina xiamenensis]|uniref:DUF306 domain-containing protein n=1 Tax=Idiomarina xiamenensis 10-D-4 TaxID=740709 RepID=K2K6S5_9GAMM|nr:META domain-containing protein [Idiomarina xiamenensis]EKE83353.1 hypothetical protein A10D4_08017 [Idiomarina xiamenensis 10-D-4]